MYDRVRREKPKDKRDPKFYIIIIVTVALIIGFGTWIWSVNHSRELFREYMGELSSATVASYNKGGADANVEGEHADVSGDALYTVYAKLTASAQIRRSSDTPDGACISIYYADGAVLKIWDTDIDVSGWTRDTGIYAEFTDPQGEVYSYITDRVQYCDIYSAITES